MMKYASRALLVILPLLLIFSVGGAYATWLYADGAIDPFESEPLTFTLGDFLWEGSGDLPTDSTVGENHVNLINNIINHAEHGLNSSDSYLNDQIADRQDGGWGWSGRDTLGSMAVTQSDELNEIFGLSASELAFLIQFVDNDTYYLFTTGVDLGERGACNIFGNTTVAGSPTVPIGQNVYPIYKTVIEKIDGTWTAVSTTEGYAKSAWYEESRSNSDATQIPSFDPDTFVEGQP